MYKVAIIGTGFVADFYMRSLEVYPDITLECAYDRNPEALNRFCNFWQAKKAESLEAILAMPEIDLVLNLTNPSSHYEVSKLCLLSDKNVYSEKPLAVEMNQAYELHELATSRNILLGSAPCSFLGEAAQTIRHAIDRQLIGKPYLVYAELDDDFVPQAPYKKWLSESGAPWPYADEFKVGCTLEHAGYYLTWLMPIFGGVTKVIAASANLIDNKLEGEENSLTAPDFATATLFFESGVVARLTCSIIAPHDHRLRVFGEKGILYVDEAWNNSTKVKFKKRFSIRRKLITGPFSKTVKLRGPTHIKVSNKCPTPMNFALGPAEMLSAAQQGVSSRVCADFALHLNEVTLAIQNSHDSSGVQVMQSKMPKIEPMPWAN